MNTFYCSSPLHPISLGRFKMLRNNGFVYTGHGKVTVSSARPENFCYAPSSRVSNAKDVCTITFVNLFFISALNNPEKFTTFNVVPYSARQQSIRLPRTTLLTPALTSNKDTKGISGSHRFKACPTYATGASATMPRICTSSIFN